MRIVSVLFFSLTVSLSFAQSNFLEKMTGEWKVEGKMFSKTGDVMATFEGVASWQKIYEGRYIHENFSFDFNGNKIIGEAFLGESKKLNRFEFTQIDNTNPAMFIVTGNWNDSLNTLEMVSVPGSIQLMWHYVFHDDETFTKKMYLPTGDGNWFVQSEYHYINKE